MIRFCPLFSSSSGNSVYIGENNAGILVDVGRSAKQIREKLDLIGVEESAIKAVFLSPIIFSFLNLYNSLPITHHFLEIGVGKLTRNSPPSLTQSKQKM